MTILDWSLSVASSQRVDGWLAEASRLRSVLDTVADSLHLEYDVPLSWYNMDVSADVWNDPHALAGYLESEQLRDDTGKRIQGGGSNSMVQAYPPDGGKNLIGVTFSVGRAGDLGISVIFRFRRIRPLRERSVDWLIKLINSACRPIEGDAAIITSNPLKDVLVKVKRKHMLGALTLVPQKIDSAALPDSLTTYPGPSYLPDAVIVAVKDLGRLTDNPASLVDDFLRLDELISASDGN